MDLNPLRNVTTVGGYFLTGCSSLSTVDLNPLRNVLTIVDLVSFGNVTTVGDDFLEDCYALTTVDLAPLANVTKVGSGCLKGCDEVHVVGLDKVGPAVRDAAKGVPTK